MTVVCRIVAWPSVDDIIEKGLCDENVAPTQIITKYWWIFVYSHVSKPVTVTVVAQLQLN